MKYGIFGKSMNVEVVSKITSIHCQQKLNRTKICKKVSIIRFTTEHINKCSK